MTMQALATYQRDNGRYPTQGQGLRALTDKPTAKPAPNFWKDGGYLRRFPNDPRGSAYRYVKAFRRRKQRMQKDGPAVSINVSPFATAMPMSCCCLRNEKRMRNLH